MTQYEKEQFLFNLYAQEKRRLVSIAFRLLKNKNDVEDVVQDTFIIAISKADEVVKHPCPSKWLVLTLKNRIRNLNRIYIKEQNLVFPLENQEIATFDSISKEALILLLKKCLSKQYYDIFVDYYFKGIDIKNIALAHNISLSACKMRLKRSRDLVKFFLNM